MKRKGIKQLALRLSEGLLGTTVDALLFQFYLLGSSVGKSPNMRGGAQMVDEAFYSLEEFNYKTLKRSLLYLKRKGLVSTLKEFEITALGRQRLKEVLPTYHTKRPWDGYIYLITYDILEEKREYRDQLRKMLKKLGAGCLQQSVWLTPYNPGKILKDFSQTSGFEGEVIISRMGKDGYIGEQSIKELIARVYDLDALNDRYEGFVYQFKSTFHQLQSTPESLTKSSQFSKSSFTSPKSQHKWNTAVSYLCILQDDPQLPWELLPDNWSGDEAYLLYQKIITQSI